MHCIIRCGFGLSRILHTECKRFGIAVQKVDHGAVHADLTADEILNLYLHSRVASRIYRVCGNFFASTFDEYFDAIRRIEWEKYGIAGVVPTVLVQQKNCILSAIPSLQSVGQKSIADAITSPTIEKNGGYTVLFDGVENQRTVLLDIFGRRITERGLRHTQGDAPLREDLAAALILLSGRRVRDPFYDPFAGSGTIAIEACMFAKNIPPKYFSSAPDICFSRFCPTGSYDDLRLSAAKHFYEKEYTIVARDIDPAMGKILQKNIETHPLLANTIRFEPYDAMESSYPAGSWICTNPPYDKRLHTTITPDQIFGLYQKNNCRGGFVYGDTLRIPIGRKYHAIYNGSIPSGIYCRTP